MQDIFVQTSRGRSHALTAGSGLPLILLHSNGGSAYEYDHVIGPLSARYRVIALDLPGQGDSDPLAAHMSVADYADWVVEVMDGLSLGQALVAGASIGGAICVALGARNAKRFSRIFVVECPFRPASEWAANWARTEANYAPVTQSIDKVRPRLRDLTPELFERWNIDRAKAGTKTCLSVMWALRDYDMTADLKLFPAGQVLVFGDRSPTVGKIDAFRAATRDARLHVIENCGHFPMIDDPDAFMAIIDAGARKDQ